VVEADSLRFHRTPMQQRADLLRDQRHLLHFTPLRFSHYQVIYEPDYVERTLRGVAARLAADAA
jgi:hypothetical protein